MADEARRKTDRKLKLMEKRIVSIYQEAEASITQDWIAYMERGEQRLSTLYDKWKTTGDMDDLKAYQDAARSYTLQNEHYKAMIDATTTQMAQANTTALAYVNNQMPSVYTVNYRQAQKDIDKVGINFTIRNEATIKRLIQDRTIKLPKKKVAIPKDKRWNTKLLNSAVLQGVIQGDSMRDIAKRILPVIGNNESAAIRNARTMVTGAENRGRMDSYTEMKDAGIVMQKVWMATPDGRTRAWHLDMDGQAQEVDDPFIDGNGNKLMYPGDPEAAPESVYNCRCTMTTKIVGFRKADGRIEYVDEQNEESMHDRQMAEERERRQGQVPEQGGGIPEFDADEWMQRLKAQDLATCEEWTDEWLKLITDDEREGVRTYTGAAYGPMNEYLRGLASTASGYESAIDDCTRALDKASLPEATIVRRGSGFGSLQGLLGVDTNTMDTIKEGDVGLDIFEGMLVQDKGFMSTSPDPEGGFTGERIEYIINIPQGAHAMYIAPISKVRHENELLIQRGSKFVIEQFDVHMSEVTGKVRDIQVFMSML